MYISAWRVLGWHHDQLVAPLGGNFVSATAATYGRIDFAMRDLTQGESQFFFSSNLKKVGAMCDSLSPFDKPHDRETVAICKSNSQRGHEHATVDVSDISFGELAHSAPGACRALRRLKSWAVRGQL